MMLGGVPNMAYAVGYTNASWTLKVRPRRRVRLPAAGPHGRARLRQCTPRAPDPSLPTQPFIDLNSGYVLRSIDALPKQGLQGAVAAVPELRARHAHAAPRRARGRGDGVLDAARPAERHSDTRPVMPSMVSIP